MRDRRTIELRCYPREDQDFLADAQRAVAESWATARQARQLLDLVRAKLREQYPKAHVQPREHIADTSETDPDVWYCYRDGGFAA